MHFNWRFTLCLLAPTRSRAVCPSRSPIPSLLFLPHNLLSLCTAAWRNADGLLYSSSVAAYHHRANACVSRSATSRIPSRLLNDLLPALRQPNHHSLISMSPPVSSLICFAVVTNVATQPTNAVRLLSLTSTFYGFVFNSMNVERDVSL